MKITFDEKNIVKAQAVLGACPDRVKYAARYAINRTVTKLQAQVAKEIVKNYFISAADVKAAITTKQANKSSLSGMIASTGSPLLITHFRLRPSPKDQIRFLKGEINYDKVGLISTAGRTRRRRPKPMTVQIKRGSPSATVPGLFVRRSSKTNYAGPIFRYLKTRYPLCIPYGPSVPQMFGSPKVLEELAPQAEKYLNKRFLHEVEVQLSKI